MKKERIKKFDVVNIWQFKVLEYITYGIVFLIPLYINYHHAAAITMPKQLLLFGAVCGMVGLYIWGKWNDPENLLVITKTHIALGVFFLAITISGLMGVDPQYSFFGTWQSNLSITLFYALGIFGVFIGFLVRRNKQFLPALSSAVLSSGVIVAAITYFGVNVIKLSNDGSTIGNNSYLGAYLLLVVCMGMGIFFWYQKIWQKIIIVLGVISILLSPVFLNRMIWSGQLSLSNILHHPTLILGGANGAEIGLIIAVMVMLLLYLTRSIKKPLQILGGVGFAVLLVGIWTTGVVFMNPSSGLHKSFVEQKSENRFIFWDIARQGFVERPLLGYGMNNYPYPYQQHTSSKIFDKDGELEIWTTRPHNIFWEYLVVSGIIGTLAFVVVIGGVFIILYKESGQNSRIKKIFGIVFAGALFGYTFQNLFVFDTMVPLILFFIVVGTAIGFSEEYYTVTIGNLQKKTLLVIMGGVSVVGLMTLCIFPWHESLAWGRLVQEENIVKIPKLISDIQAISLVGNIQDTALFADQCIEKIQELIPSLTQNNAPYVLGTIDALTESLTQGLIDQPNSFRGHLVAGNLITLRLMITQDKKDVFVRSAESHLKDASLLSPANPMTYMSLANVYTIAGDNKSAYNYLRAGIAIAPTFIDSYKSARSILKIAPNRDFEKYLTTMEKRWGMEEVQ